MNITKEMTLAQVVEVLADELDGCVKHMKLTDPAIYIEPIEQLITQARCHPQIRQRVLTEAPAAYDYGYVIELDANVGKRFGKVVRLVAIPLSHVTYQRQRYSSGLYSSVIDNESQDTLLFREDMKNHPEGR